jgi:hypothetical protein
MRLYAAIATNAVVLLQSISARAETFSLSITDATGCAEQQRLIEQVTARAQGATFLKAGGRANFLLRFERRANKVVAELQIHSPDNPETTRVVDGESCQEVTAAVALIMALTLDTRAGSAGTQRKPVTNADAAPVSSPKAQLPTGSADSRTYAVEGDFAEQGNAKSLEISPHGSPWRIGIGAELGWTTLFTNDGGMWLFGLRGEGARAKRLFTIIRAFLGPKVVRDVGNGATAAFSLYGAGLELGTPVVGSRSLATDAMLVASMGGLLATSVQQGQTTNSRSATSTWVGLGPGLRLRWFNDSASLAFQVTVPVDIVRPRFMFLSADGLEQVAYQTSPVGILFGLCGTWNVEPSSQTHRIKRVQ